MTVFETQGPKLLANGSELQLHGVNWSGFESLPVPFGLWSWRTIDQFLDHIKRRNFNTLRLPIGRPVFNKEVPGDNLIGAGNNSPNNYLRGKNGLEILDTLIEACEKRGIYFYLNSYVKNPAGSIEGLWYNDGYSEQNWIDDIVMLSKRYRSARGFVGIDSCNEPSAGKCTWGSGDPRTDWKMANEKLYAEMSKANPDIIIIIETLNAGGSLTPMLRNPPNIPKHKRAWSPHVYFQKTWTGDGWAMPGLLEPDLRRSLPPVWGEMFTNEANNECIIVGEFGSISTGRDAESQEIFVDEMIKKKVLNTTYWTWPKDSTDTGGIVTDDKYEVEDMFKINLLERLRTPLARYSTDAAPPKVTTQPPAPTTKPTGTPLPGGDIKPGDHVQLITRDGPKMVVVSVTDTRTALCVSAHGQVSIHLKYLVKV